MKKYLYTFFAVVLLMSSSCKKNVVEPHIDTSSFYFPIDSGYTWTYQMDSTVYNGKLGPPDTFNYWVENKAAGSFIRVDGLKSYRIERSRKNSPGSSWIFSRTFSATKTSSYVLETDFNQTKVIHDFPVLLNKEWDGHQYIGEEVDFYYEEVHSPNTIGGIYYDSTCTVIEEIAINAVQSFFTKEIYAKDVGLVHRHFEALENLGSPNQKGVKYTINLISFDK